MWCVQLRSTSVENDPLLRIIPNSWAHLVETFKLQIRRDFKIFLNEMATKEHEEVEHTATKGLGTNGKRE